MIDPFSVAMTDESGKYRKKPVVIDAFQIGSDRFYPDWLHDAISRNDVITHAAPGSDGWGEPFDNAEIKTLEGVMHAERGDWIIKGVKGEIYSCKPDIFAMTYEPALLQSSPTVASTGTERWAKAIHYPEHWDTACYQTLEEAITETLEWHGCAECFAARLLLDKESSKPQDGAIAWPESGEGNKNG